MYNTIKAAIAALASILAPLSLYAGEAFTSAQYPVTFNWTSADATSGTYYQITASGGGRARIYGPNSLYVLSTSSVSGWGQSGSYYLSAEAPVPGAYAMVSIAW